jgi:tRNA (cytosine34-C5)-methyltransferase
LLPARDLKQLLKELGADVQLKSLTPAVANAARAISPGSCIVELKKVGGGRGTDESCPPIAVELTAEVGSTALQALLTSEVKRTPMFY